VGSIDRRIQRLEEHMKPTTSEEWNAEREASLG
jgi:hypothetical protein